MFRQLATGLVVGPNFVGAADAVLTGYRPSQLSEFLELFWSSPRDALRQAALGVAAGPHIPMARVDRLDPLPGAAVVDPPVPPGPVQWHHLVYAYMLENTRIVDIFQRVVTSWLTGERLPPPTIDTQRWLQATEQLFFSRPWPYSVRAVTSDLRPDAGAVRRNAYFRLLGMDLTHGTEDGRAYSYVKPDVANRDFHALFEALLVEAWRGYTNLTNLNGANNTDDTAIATLLRRLQEMLLARRNQGLLSREEFEAVALGSWLHLTVEYNTAIVVNLTAQAAGIADRLKKIGDMVGLPAHARSDAYFQLAEPMSRVLIEIESGNAAALGIGAVYTPGTMLAADMLTIITNWSIATGRPLKEVAPRPLTETLLAPSYAPATNGNGSRIAAFVR